MHLFRISRQPALKCSRQSRHSTPQRSSSSLRLFRRPILNKDAHIYHIQGRLIVHPIPKKPKIMVSRLTELVGHYSSKKDQIFSEVPKSSKIIIYQKKAYRIAIVSSLAEGTWDIYCRLLMKDPQALRLTQRQNLLFDSDYY